MSNSANLFEFIGVAIIKVTCSTQQSVS